MSTAADAQQTPSRTPWGAIALISLPPALIAVLQLGRLHPDEVFQVLEPAHIYAFGKGVVTWEWVQGLRNWALPGLLGWLLQACHALGIDDPQARRGVLEIPQYLIHLASLGAVYRLIGRRTGPSDPASGWIGDPALWGVLLIGAYAPVLHFAGRTLGESISTSLLLWGLERADARRLAAPQYVLGGVLLGLAVVVRYGSAVVAVAALLWLFLIRRPIDAVCVAVGGALVACLLGLLDWATWGQPFHSLLQYLSFNVTSNGAAHRFGASPYWFYVPWLFATAVVWLWPSLICAAYRLRVRWASSIASGAMPSGLLLFCAGAYLLAISIAAHKEQRFLYPALVLLAAGAAPVWVSMVAALPRARAAALLVGSLCLGLGLLAFNTRFTPKETHEFRLAVKAARGGTGVVLADTNRSRSSGQFYAGDRAWQRCGSREERCLLEAVTDSQFDRVLGHGNNGAQILREHGFRVIETQEKATLWARP